MLEENNKKINLTELKKVSIIIPVYNMKDYLEEAIESVISQTYKNIEIIIIDDGSNDGSEKICDDYSRLDSRIKVIHQENKGLSAARNKGLEIMTGDYVAYLDPDDVYHPKMIEMLHDKMINEDVDCVICNFISRRTTKKLEFKSIKKIDSLLKIKERNI